MLTALFPIFLVYYKTGLLFSTVLASSFFRFRSYSHFFFFFLNSKVGKSGLKKKRKKRITINGGMLIWNPCNFTILAEYYCVKLCNSF